jgi:tetratricopeptide (TPR) repeat protein
MSKKISKPLAPIQWEEELSPATLVALVPVARKVLAQRPDKGGLWLLAGRSLSATGDTPAALAHFRKAVEAFPEDVPLRRALVTALVGAGEYEEALATLRANARCLEFDGALALDLAMRLGHWDEAADIAALAEALTPSHPTVVEYQGQAFARDPERLLATCDKVLAREPAHANAIHYRAYALARLGRGEEARESLALDRFVHVGQLAFDEAFHAKLRGELLVNDTLRADPRGKALLSGLKSGILVRCGDQATPELCAAIREAIQGYASALEGDHGFVRGRPAKARLDAWAVIYNQDGRQVPHRHAAGWLSGVFYVGGEGAAQAGPLLIGAVKGDESYPGGPVRRIAPQPGRLVLFPSYMMHATEPAEPGGRRISIAFDVLPAA